jgi:DNA-binding transcriptional MerR regulator
MSVGGVGEDVTYSVGEAAARTGMSRQGLLSWERRYGFPRPARDAKGHRRYSADDLLAIALVRAGVQSGRDVASAIREVLARTPSASGPAATELPGGLLRNVLDSLPFPLAIVRAPRFEHVYVNPTLVRAVPSVRLGQPVQSLPGVRTVSALERVARHGDPWTSEAEPVIVDGELRYFKVTWMRLAPIEGHPIHLVGFGSDRTEEARVRRRLRRSIATGDDRHLVEEARHSRFLRALVSLVGAGSTAESAASAIRSALKRTCELLDADAATVARIDGDVVVPSISAIPTRGLRWRAFSLAHTPQIQQALERGAIRWVQASRTNDRRERALLARMVVRTVCAAPVRHGDRTVGLLLVRWSLNAYQPSFDAVDFMELQRHVLGAPTERVFAACERREPPVHATSRAAA